MIYIHVLGHYGNLMRQKCGLSNMISTTTPSSSSSLHSLRNRTPQADSLTLHNNNNNATHASHKHISNTLATASFLNSFFISQKSITLCQQHVIHNSLNWTITDLAVHWNRWVRRYRNFYVTIENITHAYTLAHTTIIPTTASATTTTSATTSTTNSNNSNKSVALSSQPHIITYESMQKDKHTVIHSLLTYLHLPHLSHRTSILTEKGHNSDLPIFPSYSRRRWVKRSNEDLSYILIHYTSMIQHLSYDPMCICILQQLTSNVVEIFEQCNVYISSITHNSTVCLPL